MMEAGENFFWKDCNEAGDFGHIWGEGGLKGGGAMRDRDMAAVYEEYAPVVYKYLFCLTRDRALSEELTQETFCQALRSVKNFKGECKLSVWLCQIAKRLWYRELKRRRRAVAVPLEEKLISPQDVEGEFLEKAGRMEIYRQLHLLDENTREVMYLRLTGELSFAQIGDIMGRSENWARVTFYRGRQKIAKEWKMDE